MTPLQRRSRQVAAALAVVFELGCTQPLIKYRTDVPALQLSVVGQPAATDGRVRFREIYCGVLGSAALTTEATCDTALVRLSDEPPVRSDVPPLPGPDARLHILFIGGAFGDCIQSVATPVPGAIAKLSGLGYRIRVVSVSGRSSSARNAREIARAVREEPMRADDKLVLVGYSKGTADILEFLVGNPELALRVDAVVSIAGTVNGSPLGDAYAGLYEKISNLALKRCDAGDGGVMKSLRVTVRMSWLAAHRLPGNARYFSLGSFTSSDQTARLMSLTKRGLTRAEPLNDGQMIFYDQLIPGSVLLGYANGDHWAVILPLQEKWPYWAGNAAGTHYPRDLLFEAVVFYVGEALR